MLDFSTLTIDMPTGGTSFDVFFHIWCIASVLSVILAVVFAVKKDATIVFSGIALAFLFAALGFSRFTNQYTTFSVEISPRIQGVEQLVDGETIVKRGDRYYFLDTFPRLYVSRLNKSKSLNREILQDFQNLAEGYIEESPKEGVIHPQNEDDCKCGQSKNV